MKIFVETSCDIRINQQGRPALQHVISHRGLGYSTLWEAVLARSDIRCQILDAELEIVRIRQDGKTHFYEGLEGTIRLLRKYRIELDLVEKSSGLATVPMFSVIVRTTGSRPDALERALICLANQTFRQFEVIVVVSSLEFTTYQLVAQAVQRNVLLQGMDVRILHAESTGRTPPLNLGLLAARGERIAFLDDDDYVLSNWLEIFLDGLAVSEQKEVVRQGVVSVRRTGFGEFDEEQSLAESLEVSTDYCSAWDFFRSCHTNQTPIHGWSCVNPNKVSDGLFFDEALHACEDWNYLMRSAVINGVRDFRKVGGVYNLSLGESRKVESPESWERAVSLTRNVLNSLPVSLAPNWLASLDTKSQLVAEQIADVNLIRSEFAELERARRETELELQRWLKRSPLFALKHPIKWWELWTMA